MEIKDLPDFPSLVQLASALWKTDPRQRGAALLVGAGMSRNANMVADNLPPPPLWSDVRSSLASRLYTEPSGAPYDPLRLAEEYRAYLGQAALNQHLRELVDDKSWNPGPEHLRLLQLPWSDVLTTNFDTLLERAASQITAFDYDIVRSTTDLVQARAPRIVKLHGSIGEDDLVIAEDDFRTYSSKRAAFVNLARQIFIENELCLIGFSGTDPNFLQWSGWVRDHLGDSRRRIYLVGTLGLSSASRRLLEARNVAPIDLAPLVADVPPDRRGRIALSALLQHLHSLVPRSPAKWLLRSGESAGPSGRQGDQAAESAARERLLKQVPTWEAERKAYPGWLVCPPHLRMDLSFKLSPSSRDFALALKHLTDTERTHVVLELVWRFEIAYERLPRSIASCAEEIVRTSSPWHCGETGLALCEAVLRIARDKDASDFDALAARMVDGAEPQHAIHCVVAYQKALRCRDRFDFVGIEAAVDSIDGTDPVWRLRRAYLLCGLRRWGQASTEIEAALRDLRQQEKQNRSSLWIRSRRCWAEWLYSVRHRRTTDPVADWTNQANTHDRRLFCDPWEHFEYLRSNTYEAVSKAWAPRARMVVPQFEAGSYKTYEIASRPNTDFVNVSYALRRTSEAAGVPPLFEYVNVFPMGPEAISLHDPQSAADYFRLIHALHSYDHHLIDEHFSRVAVARMDKTVRDQLFDGLFSAVRYWLTRIPEKDELRSTTVSATREAISILHRVAVAVDGKRAREAFQLGLEIGGNPNLQDIWLLEFVRNLVQNSSSAVPLDEQPHLLLPSIQFPLESEIKCWRTEGWGDPVTYLRCRAPARLGDLHIWASRIEGLLGVARRSIGARAQALIWLKSLDALGVLTTSERKQYGEALWQVRGDDGLPARTRFYKHAFVDLPAPADVDVRALVEAAICIPSSTARRNPELLVELVHAASRKSEPVLPNQTYAAELLKMLCSQNPMVWVGDENPFEPREDHRYVVGLAIARSFVPTIGRDCMTSGTATRLLELVDQGLIVITEALPYCSGLIPDDVIVTAISSGLHSDAPYAVTSAAAAVRIASLVCRDTRAAFVDRLIEALLVSIEVGPRANLLPLLKEARGLAQGGLLAPDQVQRLGRSVSRAFTASEYQNLDVFSRMAANASLIRAECVLFARLFPAVLGISESARILKDAQLDPLPEVRSALQDQVDN